MEIITNLIFWIVWIVGIIFAPRIASNKGYSGFAWFLYGLLLAPIAIVHALLMSPLCPYCTEKINRNAKRCPHCTSELNNT